MDCSLILKGLPSRHLKRLVRDSIWAIFHVFISNALVRIIKWGIPGAFVVVGALLIERNKIVGIPSLLVSLGNSSYSLYLSHIFTISVIGKLWMALVGSMYGIFIVIATVGSIIVGHLSYVILEKPVTSLLSNTYRNKLRARVLGFSFLR